MGKSLFVDGEAKQLKKDHESMDVNQTIASCPFCGCGRCAVRICSNKEMKVVGQEGISHLGHAFVLCDSCHATWSDPDLSQCHQYLSAISPACPVCEMNLSDPDSSDLLSGSWASQEQLSQLGWGQAFGPFVEGKVGLKMDDIETLFQRQPL